MSREGRVRLSAAALFWNAWIFFAIVFFATAWVPWTLLFAVLCLLMDHERKMMGIVNQAWCRLIGNVFPYMIHSVRGQEKIVPGESYIIAANHESAADIILLSYLDVPFRWVAKHTLYLVPVFGWQLWLLGHISIRRGSKASRRRFMKRARSTLAAGISILIFPEGTRARTRAMKPFKPGAFLLARDTGRPILPVVIAGTFDAMPPHQHTVPEPFWALVKVLDPVEITASTPEEIEKAMTDLRDLMIREKVDLDREAWVLKERARRQRQRR